MHIIYKALLRRLSNIGRERGLGSGVSMGHHLSQSSCIELNAKRTTPILFIAYSAPGHQSGFAL
jgi:hypothetical protein